MPWPCKPAFLNSPNSNEKRPRENPENYQAPVLERSVFLDIYRDIGILADSYLAHGRMKTLESASKTDIYLLNSQSPYECKDQSNEHECIYRQ